MQGGVDAGLRRRSAEALVGMDFPGYGIGGLAVGEGQELMLATLDGVLPILPADKPRYLMGVGSPSDLIKSVARGVDMFDCVLPTRNGRHGLAFTWNGKVNLRNAWHAEDPAPLDPESACPAARDYSRAYLHHLVKSGEYLGAMLLSWVNTAFYQELMARDARRHRGRPLRVLGRDNARPPGRRVLTDFELRPRRCVWMASLAPGRLRTMRLLRRATPWHPAGRPAPRRGRGRTVGSTAATSSRSLRSRFRR